MVFSAKAVLEHIQKNGPQVPNAIRQVLGAQDNFVVGAVLSELLGSRDLAMTDLTYGTSKFYYDPKYPESLEALGKYLNEKDNRAFELLKSERVVRHTQLSPLNRVAMAQIKDFSRHLKLMTPDGEELFWRYYLVPEDEAMDLIEERFFGHLKKHAPEPTPVPAPVAKPEPIQATVSTAPTSSPVSSNAPSATPESVPAKPKRKTTAKKKAAVSTQQQTIPSASTITTPAPTAPPLSRAPIAAGEFSTRIAQYFAAKDIKLVEDLGSTKSELTAIVAVPSAIGEMRYYCKAKVKKITGDGDIAPSFIEAQQRGLPLLYIAAGTLTRKAQELVPTLKGTVVMTPWTHGT